MEVYKYRSEDSYESNFNRWYLMNSDERRQHNEKTYTEEEAWSVFYNNYGKRLAHTIKINTDGILEDVLVLEE